MDMKTEAGFWDEVKYKWFVVFAWLLLPGVAGLVCTIFLSTDWMGLSAAIMAILCLLPFMIHLELLTLWHWKDRYRGRHSKLWGALILLEQTGWFKLIYLFRHVLPDRRGHGRYAAIGTVD